MSRAPAFDDVYAVSRARLLLQLYAYCGDPEVAQDALSEAYIAASSRWQRVGGRPNVEGWIRSRAIRRIDRRPRVLQEAAETRGRSKPDAPSTAELATPAAAQATLAAGAPHPVTAQRLLAPSAENARLLTVLASMDRVSRRLLIVRRLDQVDLADAAAEAGLAEAVAEQTLARAVTTLHAAGIDTTPAGLNAQLTALAGDLAAQQPPPAQALRRAGERRRYAATAVIGLGVAAAVASASFLVVTGPFSSPRAAATSPTPSSSQPSPPAPPVASLGSRYLLPPAALAKVDPGGGWQALPDALRPGSSTGLSIYGPCMMAADDPPPETSWVRDFDRAGSVEPPTAIPLRQVLLQAPSEAEATRTFHQLNRAFTSCASGQLLGYQAVRGLGDRSRLVSLRFSRSAGVARESVLIARTGAAVTVLLATSGADRPADLDTPALTSLGAAALGPVCARLGSSCSRGPYPLASLRLPSDANASGFLSVVDLPLVPSVTATWAATNPQAVSDNPSATVCDQANFGAAGALAVASRSYVMPGATRLPAVFGLTETIGSFPSARSAQAFLTGAAARVRTCHLRKPTMTLRGSSTFASNAAVGRVWRIKQQVSPQRSAVYRVALIRHGSTVAEVTFTPVGRYDVQQSDYVWLARRAGVRLRSYQP